MPYLLISTQVRLERGPTIVGDNHADVKLMARLNAQRHKLLGNDFDEWRSDDPPRVVLNKLEKEGYKVVGMTGIGQTCAWTLYKPEENNN